MLSLRSRVVKPKPSKLKIERMLKRAFKAVGVLQVSIDDEDGVRRITVIARDYEGLTNVQRADLLHALIQKHCPVVLTDSSLYVEPLTINDLLNIRRYNGN